MRAVEPPPSTARAADFADIPPQPPESTSEPKSEADSDTERQLYARGGPASTEGEHPPPPPPQTPVNNTRRRSGRRQRRFTANHDRHLALGDGDWLNASLRPTELARARDANVPVFAIPNEEGEGSRRALATTYYSVQAAIGLQKNAMLQTVSVMDTGCGYNLVNHGALPASWRSKIYEDATLPSLGDANGKPLKLEGSINLRVRIGGQRFCVRFCVARGLACDVLLGTAFLNKWVQAIRCISGYVELTRSRVPIMGHPARDAEAVMTQGPRTRSPWEGQEDPPSSSDDEAPTNPSSSTKQPKPTRRSNSTRAKIHVARTVHVPALSQAYIEVSSATSGMIHISPKDALFTKKRVRLANGIHEVEENEPFRLLISNFSPRPVRLQKNTVVGYATQERVMVVDVPEKFARRLCHDLALPVPELPLEDQPAATEEGPAPPEPKPPDPASETQPDWRTAVDLSHIEDEATRERILHMLEKHHSMWDGRLGEIKATDMRINLREGAQAQRQQAYRAGPTARETINSQVEDQLKQGVLEEAHGEWAAPVVLAPKADGSMRFCVDYRRLNALTIPDTYPLPRMDDCIDSLGDANIFTTLDANSGYWQINIAEEDRDKTTFVCHRGLYRYRRMPFGLRNAPACFQRALDIILSGVRWRTCLIYLDDVIVFSKTLTDHIDHLDEVLTLLGDAGISLKLRKCSFFQRKVTYLGHVILPGKLAVAADSTKAIRDAIFPKTLTQLRSFLGACNVYRRFVKGFAKIAHPLTAMLQKNAEIDWDNPTEAQRDAFAQLRDILLSPPVLGLPKANRPYMVDTDASEYQLGATLLQQQDDDNPTSWTTIGYWSRALTKEEKNYSATERECLAVIWGLQTLRPYVEGTHILIRTDHAALRWLVTLKDPTGRLARWSYKLSTVDYEIIYRPGRQHQVPDALSRLLTFERESDPVQPPIDDDIPTFGDPAFVVTRRRSRAARQRATNADGIGLSDEDERLTPLSSPHGEHELPNADEGDPPSELETDLADASEADPEADATDFAMMDRLDVAYRTDPDGTVRPDVTDEPVDEPSADNAEDNHVVAPISLGEMLTEQALDPWCHELIKDLGPDKPFFRGRDGVIRRRHPRERGVTQIATPKPLRARLCPLAHHHQLAGHPGHTRMLATLRLTYYWPEMAADIMRTVRTCPDCAKNRLRMLKHSRPMKLFPTAAPFEQVALDLLGPLPKTPRGNQHILVMACRFSKLTQVVPLRSATAITVAKAFCTHWVYKYGAPRQTLTDNGPQFASKLLMSTSQELGVKNVFTSAYHPQANGQVERYNRTLAAMLRCFVDENPTDWDLYADALTYAYNCSVHRSTGARPFDLVLTQPPSSFTTTITEDEADPSARNKFPHRAREVMDKARAQLGETQARYKRDFDKRVRAVAHKPATGGYVYLDPYDGSKGKSKLQHNVEGPYRVLDVTDRTATVQRGGVAERVTLDRLTPAPINATEKASAPPPVAAEHLPSPADLAEKNRSGPSYLVDKITDHRVTGPQSKRRYEFLVHWVGYADPK